MDILISPHNDDETLFASLLIMRRKPLVIIVTDGEKHLYKYGLPIEQRRQESIEAMQILGASVMFLNIPETKLTEEILTERLKYIKPEGFIYAPAVDPEGNFDHNVVGAVADKLWGSKVVHYSTYKLSDLTPQGDIELHFNPEERAKKELALNKYTSQLTYNRPHFDAVKDKCEYLVNPLITELCKMAFKYQTDKVANLGHNYTPIYHELFKDKRETVKKVLEIGIGFPKTMPHVKDYQPGASLFLWQEYFPNAEIYACDIKEEILINQDRIKSFKCDQSKEEQLKELSAKIGNDFDLIIDDGSHEIAHQILSARILAPLLKDDGAYIIEDVDRPFEVVSALKEYNPEVLFPDKPFRLEGQDDERNKLIIIRKRNNA